MISATAILILKTVIMIILLAGIALLLFGIGHIFHSDDLNSLEDDINLRKEIRNNENVIGKKNIFSNFVVRNYTPQSSVRKIPAKHNRKKTS